MREAEVRLCEGGWSRVTERGKQRLRKDLLAQGDERRLKLWVVEGDWRWLRYVNGG